MNKLLFIGIFFSQFAFAQGELNNNPPSNPQAQQVLNVDENLPTGQAGNINDEQVQSPGNDVKQQKDKEQPCKDCEEIKKIKKQQIAQHTGSGITSGNGKTKHAYFKKFCAKTSKKWNRAFVRHKKNRPDYSCFNW